MVPIKPFVVCDIPDGDTVLKTLNTIARTCYKSEQAMSSPNYDPTKLPAILIKNGHEAMLEHVSFSAKFVTNRSTSHELVRHRMASFAQESQRYCNYGTDKFDKQVVFVTPIWAETHFDLYPYWVNSCDSSEKRYLHLLEQGLTPQEARSVLTNDCKTDIWMTANLREWRHMLKLRTAPDAHPEIRRLMVPLTRKLKAAIPVIFDDIELPEGPVDGEAMVIGGPTR